MGEAGLEIRLTHLDGSERIALRGELDYTATEAKAEELERLLSLRRGVVLDLGGLSYMDSAGIRFFLRLAERHEGPLTLEAAQPGVRRVLDITGLTPMFHMRD